MKIFSDLIDGNLDTEYVTESKVIEDILEQYTDDLKQYKTARLWIQNVDMLDILKKIIKAERTRKLDVTPLQ